MRTLSLLGLITFAVTAHGASERIRPENVHRLTVAWTYDTRDSIVALRGSSGEVAWHFQTVHHDLWDYDVASPTQPFPSKPASLAPQQIGENDVWGATPEDRDACLRTLRSLRNEGVFTPPSVQGSLHVPGAVGGLHWGGMAWDPRNRLLIAPINRLQTIIRLIPRAQFDAARSPGGRRSAMAWSWDCSLRSSSSSRLTSFALDTSIARSFTIARTT